MTTDEMRDRRDVLIHNRYTLMDTSAFGNREIFRRISAIAEWYGREIRRYNRLIAEADQRDGTGDELDAPETPDNDIDERWYRQADREDHNAARQHPSGF